MTIESTFAFASRQVSRALGDTVVWRPDTAFEQDDVKAVYGRGFRRVPSGDLRVSSRRPEITVALSDLDTDPEVGYEVEVRDTRFEVARVEHDIEDVSATLVLKLPTS